jgi:hypothetical protein
MATPKCVYNYDELRNVDLPPRRPGPARSRASSVLLHIRRGISPAGLQGFVAWRSNLSEDDNGGTVIKPKVLKPTDKGCWHSVFDGPISVKWFGAIRDGKSPPSLSTICTWLEGGILTALMELESAVRVCRELS